MRVSFKKIYNIMNSNAFWKASVISGIMVNGATVDNFSKVEKLPIS